MSMDDILEQESDEMGRLAQTLRKLRQKNCLKKYITFQDKEKAFKMKTQYPENESFIGSYSVDEHFENKIMLRRFNAEVKTFHEKISFMCSRNTWKTYVEKQFENVFEQYPIAFKSELDEVYKTIHDLKKTVKELQTKFIHIFFFFIHFFWYNDETWHIISIT